MRLLKVLIFVITCFQGFGQSTFSKQVKTFDRQNTAFTVLQDSTGYLISGIGYKSLGYRSHIFFTRLDHNGDTIFHKKIRKDSFDIFPGISGSLKKLDHGYILGGSYDLTNDKLLLLKYNNEGDVIWEKNYIDSLTTYYLSGVQSNYSRVGDYYLVGEVQLGTQYNITKVILLKADSMGNEVWHKTYGLPNTVNRGESIVGTPDGGWLLGGYTFQSKYDGLVIKLDSLGNQEWYKVLGGTNNDGEARVTVSGDSCYVVSQAYSIWDDMGSPNSVVRIVKLDQLGNIVWDRRYCQPKAERNINTIKTLGDGGFIVVGDTWADTTIQFHRGFLMRFSEGGDSLWAREYIKYSPHRYWHELYDVVETSDGGFAACGCINDDYENLFYDIWLLKTDSLGNAPGCLYAGMPDGPAPPGGGVNMLVYPNPAKEYITVELPAFTTNAGKIRVEAMHGKVVKEINAKTIITHVDTRDIPNGSYMVRYVSQGSTLASEVIIISR